MTATADGHDFEVRNRVEHFHGNVISLVSETVAMPGGRVGLVSFGVPEPRILPPRGGRDARVALGRVLASDVIAAVDAPPFDRSNVDGFAVRAVDTTGAGDASPKRLTLNAEVIARGHAPATTVAPGTATALATGGMLPRGADAVVMIEYTDLVETDDGPAIDVRRAVAPGHFLSFAGSDMARGDDREAGLRLIADYAALVEQQHLVALRVEQPPVLRRAAGTRAAMRSTVRRLASTMASSDPS